METFTKKNVIYLRKNDLSCSLFVKIYYGELLKWKDKNNYKVYYTV